MRLITGWTFRNLPTHKTLSQELISKTCLPKLFFDSTKLCVLAEKVDSTPLVTVKHEIHHGVESIFWMHVGIIGLSDLWVENQKRDISNQKHSNLFEIFIWGPNWGNEVCGSGETLLWKIRNINVWTCAKTPNIKTLIRATITMSFYPNRFLKTSNSRLKQWKELSGQWLRRYVKKNMGLNQFFKIFLGSYDYQNSEPKVKKVTFQNKNFLNCFKF